ncbi:Nif3-like dinuclear metal center hexameric protein [Pistricoccus aurantiacus]|uniref:Nif3-like dinuclear metal center hexameric protein n=1 Tax=Pistricoccus aurantiacus TaxID=1883414 RepID=UPI00363080A2
MIGRDTLVAACDARLEPARFKDFTVNGLQVSGKERINRIMSGVTACQTLLDEAVAWQADLVLVHHGYFWKNEPVEITGIKRKRLATLMLHDINLLAYHLPLDAHAELGNNAQLAQQLDLVVEGCVDGDLGQGLLWQGCPSSALDSQALAALVWERLGRKPLLIEGHDREIRSLAWCTGAAQDMIVQAWEAGADAFISGEISERTTHLARELGITYLASGHHATERYGVQAMGTWLEERFGIEHRYMEIDNPV